jgi:hypothetical protein
MRGEQQICSTASASTAAGYASNDANATSLGVLLKHRRGLLDSLGLSAHRRQDSKPIRAGVDSHRRASVLRAEAVCSNPSLDRPSRMIYFQPNQKRIRGNQNAAWRSTTWRRATAWRME